MCPCRCTTVGPEKAVMPLPRNWPPGKYSLGGKTAILSAVMTSGNQSLCLQKALRTRFIDMWAENSPFSWPVPPRKVYFFAYVERYYNLWLTQLLWKVAHMIPQPRAFKGKLNSWELRFFHAVAVRPRLEGNLNYTSLVYATSCISQRINTVLASSP